MNKLEKVFLSILQEDVDKVIPGNKQIIEELLVILEGFNYCLIGGLAISLQINRARVISPDDIDLIVSKTDIIQLKDKLIQKGFNFHGTNNSNIGIWSSFSKGKLEIDIKTAVKPYETKMLQDILKINYLQILRVKIAQIPYLLLLKMIADREKDMQDIILMLKTIPWDDIKKSKELIKKYLPDKIEDFEQYLEIAKL